MTDAPVKNGYPPGTPHGLLEAAGSPPSASWKPSRFSAKLCCLFKKIRHLLCLCQDLCIILRNPEFFLISFDFFLPEFRLSFPHPLDPGVINKDRRQIRLRKIPVIPFASSLERMAWDASLLSSHLLVSWTTSFPASRSFDLTLAFSFDGSCDSLKGV